VDNFSEEACFCLFIFHIDEKEAEFHEFNEGAGIFELY
jgi:hypothetical protein